MPNDTAPCVTSRRAILAGLAAATAVSLGPAMAATPAPLHRAPRLRPGDTVGLIEPAGFTDDGFSLAEIEETIVAMGLKPKRGRHVAERYGYLAGRDADRADDLNAMYADDSVRAVFAIRGGWGCARILPMLDYALIRKNPKLLLGYSDITALHMAFAARAGFATVHGPIAASSWGKLSWDSFRTIAFEGGTPVYLNPPGTEDRLAQRQGRIRTFRSGIARGRLLGGNLAVLTALVGTAYLPDFSGAILFLEDVEEAPYRVDRMLTQLALAGILGKLAGVVFGQCTDCTAPGPSYGAFTLSEVLDQHLAPLGIPAFQGAMIGHIANQFSLPIGIPAEIDATTGSIRILEPAVA